MRPEDLPTPYSGPPLRIAYVGNFRHQWCTERHVTNSLAMLGHGIDCWQEDETDWSAVPALVERLGIQALFWTRTWPAEMAVVEPVLKELAGEGVPTVAYHLDRWFGLDREHQVDDQPFFRCSLVVSPDDSPRWAEHGVNHLWLPPGVYAPECEPVAPNPRRWPWDVVFVGSDPYPHPEWRPYRSELLATFRRAFGRRFAVLPKERRGAPIRGRDLQELYATVPVILGDSCLAGETHRYISDRCPESVGRGAFLIHPFVPGMIGFSPADWYMASKDLMGYQLGHFDEAVDRAKYALDTPEARQQIAAHGRSTVLARDTYAHRMATVLGVAEGIHGGYRDVLPVEPPEHVLAKARAVFPVSRPSRTVAQPKTARPLRPIRARLHGWSAVFEPRPDGSGEGTEVVVNEVWGTNDYGVTPSSFRGGTVVDIGANIGAFSVLASRAGAARVIAIEPDHDNFARLTHHIALNRASRVVPVQAAVTDGSSPTVSMLGPADSARAVPGGDIPTMTLEQVIVRYGPIAFCKCDTEGNEFSMIAACPLELFSRIERMVLEWHGPVVTHLSYLRGDEFGPLVTKLADVGRVETFGHPSRGGILKWRRY